MQGGNKDFSGSDKEEIVGILSKINYRTLEHVTIFVENHHFVHPVLSTTTQMWPIAMLIVIYVMICPL